MSTAKHTPGPWIYDPQTSSVNTKIGTIVPMVPWKPNGPLIAAAPALADALVQASGALKIVMNQLAQWDEGNVHGDRALAAIDVALRAAGRLP